MSTGTRSRVVAALFAAALALLLSAASPARSTAPFEPGGWVCLEDAASPDACDGDPSPGAAATMRQTFCTGWNDDCSVKDTPVVDSHLGLFITFTPDAFGLSAADSLPVGALAGQMGAVATLALLGGSCSNQINLAFTFMNASIDTADTIDPKPLGETDLMEPLALDQDPADGIPDGADRYPSFLNDVFAGLQPEARLFGISRVQSQWTAVNLVFFQPGATIPGEAGDIHLKAEMGHPGVLLFQDPTQPGAAGPISDSCAPFLARTYTLGLTADNPCTGSPNGVAGCPGATFFENRGYPLFPCENGNTNDEDGDGKINDGCLQINNVAETGAECDNDISDDPEDSAVNDGCPQEGAESEADPAPGACAGTDEGGCTHRLNPAVEGTYEFGLLVAGQRDADGDGIENGLDGCALTSNPGWNPRDADPVNDTDNDGLPNACDPNPNAVSPGPPATCPAGFTGLDEDQDCYSNRQDNCPLVNQLENPAEPPSDTNLSLPVDSDRDNIGDACDPHPDEPDGAFVAKCVAFPVAIGAGASTAPQPAHDVPGGCTEPATASGDVDCDGDVDTVDALQVLRHTAGLSTTAGCIATAGDTDCDGDQDSVDALNIMRFVAGLVASLPVGC